MSRPTTSASEPEAQTYRRFQVALLVGLSERQVDRLTTDGKIPGVFRLGRAVLYRKAVIDKWLAGEADVKN